MRTEWDKDKVPEDFPKMRAWGWIFSSGEKPVSAYYSAREVWKYFKSHDIKGEIS